MAPKTVEDVRGFAEAISRIADLLSLLSVLPALFDSRYGAVEQEVRRERRLQQLQQQQQQEQQQEQQQDQQQQQQQQKTEDAQEDKDEPTPVVPLGLLSVFLFLLAEALACPGLFVSAAKPKGKGKGKEALGGPLGALLQGVAKTQQGSTKAEMAKSALNAQGLMANSMAQLSAFVMQAVAEPEAFDAAHCITVFVAFGALALSILSRVGWPHAKRCLRLRGAPLARVAALLLPVLLFGVLQRQALFKALRALQGEKLLERLQMPVRTVAVIAAARMGSSSGGAGRGTPPLFAGLQAASLAAALSARVATGSLAMDLAPLVQTPKLATAFDSPFVVTYVPLLIGLIWAGLAHLSKRPGQLLVAAALSCCSSPVALCLGWETLAPLVGLPAEGPGAYAAVLQIVTVGYVLTAGGLFVSGGMLCVLAGMIVTQLLLQLHGPEAFKIVLN